MKIVLERAGAWVAAAITALAINTSAVADTPPDTFVMAKDISDIITLDPAEVFEFTGGEVIANLYDRVMTYEPDDLTKLVGGVVESWELSNNGKTITFTMRPDQSFASGNPVTAEDVVYSLRRAIKLDKTPAFILNQFGWTADNVDELVKVVDGKPQITITEDLSPELVLNALSAGIASVVDSALVQEHEKDGDMGYEWLKSNSAGSGAFTLASWKANELVSMEANPNFRAGAPTMKRVIIRHVPEPSAQRLMVEKGDVDLARNLTPDQIEGVSSDANLAVQADPKAALIYLAANQDHPILGNPKVVEAIKYLVDYQGMADSFLKGQFIVHQAAWPEGLWAAYNETPYKLDVEKAKQLLAEAGHPDGFEIRLDTLTDSPYPEIAQAVQATLAQAGIKASIQTAEGKTLWPMYRGRKHELILAQWSPDYVDPHSNIDAFARNPDNRAEANLTGVLAWRNAWADEKMNEMVTAATQEQDRAKREQMYFDIQKKLQAEGPYAILFQQVEQSVKQKDVDDYVSGPTFDLIFYRNITK